MVVHFAFVDSSDDEASASQSSDGESPSWNVLLKWQRLCLKLHYRVEVLAAPCLASAVPDHPVLQDHDSHPSAADAADPTTPCLANVSTAQANGFGAWRKYTDGDGEHWWSSPDDSNWFMERDSDSWKQFTAQTNRIWWHSEDDWFFADTGRQT